MKVSMMDNDKWLVDCSHMERQDKIEGYFLDKHLKNYFDDPIISTVEIETINRCNNTCSFCPVSIDNERRQYCEMTVELFNKIIDDLAELKYSGFISLFSNNEPMLDLRIFDFMKYAKNKLPLAKHSLFSNGSLITREKFSTMVELLDYLTINNYNDDLEVLPHLKWLTTDNIDEKDCAVRLMISKKNMIRSNRGGNAPNKKIETNFYSSCILPFMQMVIRPDGKISLCCYEAYGEVTLGDLSVQSISDVWLSESYREIRKKLLTFGRNSLNKCKNCDKFGFHNFFPVEWPDVHMQSFVAEVKEKISEGKKIYIYPSNYSDSIESMLIQHGVHEIKKANEKSQVIYDSSVFIIFTSYCWDIIERIDPQNSLVGKKYVLYQDISRLQVKQTRPKFDI